MEICTFGHTDGHTVGQTDEWMDGIYECMDIYIYI